MTIKTLDEHIETTPDTASGKPRIAGRRITVQNIAIWHDRLGISVEDIAAEHDLSPAQIHAALAYYFDHRAEIDREIQESQEFVRELRARIPSKLAVRPETGGR